MATKGIPSSVRIGQERVLKSLRAELADPVRADGKRLNDGSIRVIEANIERIEKDLEN